MNKREVSVPSICKECGEDFDGYNVRVQKWCDDCKAKGEWFLNRFNLRKRLNALTYHARLRAKKKSIPYDIDIDFINDLWEYQGGKCAVSGRDLDLEAYGKKRQVNPNAPSIDRIVPELGYVKTNVRLVTYLTNVCLNEYGHEYLLDLCEDLLGNSKRLF